jgi:hypothetical protein
MVWRLLIIGSLFFALSGPASACRPDVKPPKGFKGCVFFDKSKDQKRGAKPPRTG